LLYKELNGIVVEYNRIHYDNKSSQTFENTSKNHYIVGMISDQNLLYVCERGSDGSILLYNQEGQKITPKHPIELDYPTDIDLCNNKLYIIDSKKIVICNLKFQFLSSFPIPDSPGAWNHLSVDNAVIYVTPVHHHYIYLYSEDGKVTNTIGSSSKGDADGEFNLPMGLTNNLHYLYVCDGCNDRIQVIDKKTLLFSKKWGKKGKRDGKFQFPFSIRYYDEIIYVGDELSVQLFESCGIFKQRMSINYASGLCLLNDRLYISEMYEHRIQVFRPVARFY